MVKKLDEKIFRINRKSAILTAALDLFSKKGYMASSTHEIAKKANVSEGLIFYYFKNKDGIIIYILDDIYRLYVQDLEEILSSAINGKTMLREMVTCFFCMMGKRKKEFQLLNEYISVGTGFSESPVRKMILHYNARILDIIGKMILCGQDDGSICGGPPGELALVVWGALLGIGNQNLLSFWQADYTKIAIEVTTFVERGLGRKKKRYFIDTP